MMKYAELLFRRRTPWERAIRKAENAIKSGKSKKLLAAGEELVSLLRPHRSLSESLHSLVKPLHEIAKLLARDPNCVQQACGAARIAGRYVLFNTSLEKEIVTTWSNIVNQLEPPALRYEAALSACASSFRDSALDKQAWIVYKEYRHLPRRPDLIVRQNTQHEQFIRHLGM